MAARPDVDTICAFDYNKMKKGALEGHGINYLDYHPEARGIKIPELWSSKRRTSIIGAPSYVIDYLIDFHNIQKTSSLYMFLYLFI